ncbi:uncharacterized protein isoform X3 [Leptinotarsa decemlineata]|uniref:uncharacterized protein isoform X3 n=1 Tax=Leptinotarsa decemlineata TaxID=7539 RepID=UPI000C25328A|nr:uncharacterized protein LOC111509696 isoform X2 [Leptinotarsa decemlineata]
MSKVFVYVLDKVVWLLLITAMMTQALQIAGVLDTPKGLQEISYVQGKEYNFQITVGSDARAKRETAERSKVIDSLFNGQFEQSEIYVRIGRRKVITAIM